MKNYNRRIILSIFWIVLGVVLVACFYAGILEDFWNSMGFAFIAIGILQVMKHIKYRTNKEYRENFDIACQDERNKFIANKAWAWAGYLFVMISAVACIVLKVIGYEELVPVASGSVCLIVFLYWLSYMILNRKY